LFGTAKVPFRIADQRAKFAGLMATVLPHDMPFDYLVSALVTLLVVVDPIGLAPVFAGLTAGLPPKAQRQVAQRACLIAGAVLFGTALIGDALLRSLGISAPAFEIAGGLLLFLVATEMVLGTRLQQQSKTAEQAVEDHVRNIAAFPIAIPLMAGPGAIAATVLLSAAAYSTVLWVLLILVIVAVCGATFLVFVSASEISRVLGITGNVVLSRLLGMILAALAVQYVIDGIRAVIGPGAGVH
jgi:multiple antibiotic resistance protein